MTTIAPFTRPPAVAGSFYPAEPSTMTTTLEALFHDAEDAAEGPAIAVVVPHAGWVYSGGTCAKTLARVAIPGTVVLMCPSHTGRGARVAVYGAGAWRLPAGEVPIAEELAEAICDEVELATPDRLAHAGEHAIEVIVPFLRAKNPALRIVPIVIGGLDRAEVIELGEQLAKTVENFERERGERVLVVASSDMSHYLPDDECRARDRLALTAAQTGDPSALYQTVMANDISMCGYLPVTATLAYARARAAQPPELVAYATSGDAFGDRHRVVGYAGLLIR